MLRRVWEAHRVEILTVACAPPLSIPSGIQPAGLRRSLDPWSGPPGWQSSMGARTNTKVAGESFAQWCPFDQAMDTFLDFVKEEMDDVAAADDSDELDPHGKMVEAACSLPAAQQQWCPSMNGYCPEDTGCVLWQQPADPGIKFPGIDMTTQVTLALASGDGTHNFLTELGGPWLLEHRGRVSNLPRDATCMQRSSAHGGSGERPSLDVDRQFLGTWYLDEP